MSEWGSLGGFGNVNAQMPLPVGKTDNTGALGMLLQALLRHGAMQAQPQPMPEKDDPELARLLAEAFGVAPREPMPNPAMRGY
jgi:hypothetical protein